MAMEPTSTNATDCDHFAALLERLGVSELSAEVAYERLRARLIAFFRLHLPAQAEALADEVLDRLGRRLCEGTQVDSPLHYALGIARLLLLEARGRVQRERRTVDEELRRSQLEAVASDESLRKAQAAALEACLQTLSPEDAALILDYYGADGAARIRRRQQLADALGLSLNALRNRALRLRSRLEACARSRLGVMDQDRESQQS